MLRIRENECVTELNKHQRPDIHKIYLYIKDPFESKYELLIKGLNKQKSKDLIDYFQTIVDVYANYGNYNPTKKRVSKTLDNMIADIEANNKLSHIVAKLFFRERKLDIPLVFISQSYFEMPKTIKAIHYFIMKISNKKGTSTKNIKSFV